MAEGNIDFGKYKGWDLPVFLNRLNPIPLDRYSLFTSVEEAEEYARNTTLAYIGQVISVYNLTTVKIYKINADRTITELASSDSISAEGRMVWAVVSGDTYSETDAEGNPVTRDTEGAVQVLRIKVGESISYVANLVDLTEYLTKEEAAATYATKEELFNLDDTKTLGVLTISGDDLI